MCEVELTVIEPISIGGNSAQQPTNQLGDQVNALLTQIAVTHTAPQGSVLSAMSAAPIKTLRVVTRYMCHDGSLVIYDGQCAGSDNTEDNESSMLGVLILVFALLVGLASGATFLYINDKWEKEALEKERQAAGAGASTGNVRGAVNSNDISNNSGVNNSLTTSSPTRRPGPPLSPSKMPLQTPLQMSMSASPSQLEMVDMSKV